MRVEDIDLSIVADIVDEINLEEVRHPHYSRWGSVQPHPVWLAAGSLASQLARLFMRDVISRCTHGTDLINASGDNVR